MPEESEREMCRERERERTRNKKNEREDTAHKRGESRTNLRTISPLNTKNKIFIMATYHASAPVMVKVHRPSLTSLFNSHRCHSRHSFFTHDDKTIQPTIHLYNGKPYQLTRWIASKAYRHQSSQNRRNTQSFSEPTRNATRRNNQSSIDQASEAITESLIINRPTTETTRSKLEEIRSYHEQISERFPPISWLLNPIHPSLIRADNRSMIS